MPTLCAFRLPQYNIASGVFNLKHTDNCKWEMPFDIYQKNRIAFLCE